MDDYIAIATLNDYIFCPYSIYLHNVYMDTDEGMYKATPQIKGTLVHEGVDHKTSSTKKLRFFLYMLKLRFLSMFNNTTDVSWVENQLNNFLILYINENN